MTDEHKWGWVDDDGTVHVRLPQGGDAVVGQYAAGDAEAALAFFGRKFGDLAAEVRLTAGRLQQGSVSPDSAEEVVTRIRALLEKPAFVGDIGALTAQLDALHAAAAERRLTASAERTRVRNEALAAREAIVEEAETLSSSTAWKSTGDRFKELMEAWKSLPRFDKRAEEAQWQRFSAARSAFDKARRSHFAELDAARAAAKQVKLEIVAEAEELSGSTDWGDTTRAYRALMDRWKAAPRASREDEDKLWARFRAAQDTFFDARNAENATRDADQERNLEIKEGLLARAEDLLPITDVAGARRALRDIITEWESVGFVPRNARPVLDAKLKRVEDAVARAERSEWQRTDPAMRARAQQTVDGFRASVAKLEADLAKAVAAGNTAKSKAVESSLATTQTLLEAAERVLSEYQQG